MAINLTVAITMVALVYAGALVACSVAAVVAAVAAFV